MGLEGHVIQQTSCQTQMHHFFANSVSTKIIADKRHFANASQLICSFQYRYMSNKIRGSCGSANSTELLPSTESVQDGTILAVGGNFNRLPLSHPS